MTGKDYYKILEVSPGATPLAIKKAYRRLAIKYHPDTNAGNNIYEQKFKELNEAYRVLSDAQRRSEYNNAQSSKQHAHARRQYNAKPASETVTIHTILLEAKRLKTKTAASDPDRMNKAALFRQVEHLLTRKNVRVLQEGHDEKVNATFVECIIFVCDPLPFSMVREIIHPLLQIAGTNNELFTRIREFEKKSKVNTIWNDYKLVIAFLLALLFCILIFFISE